MCAPLWDLLKYESRHFQISRGLQIWHFHPSILFIPEGACQHKIPLNLFKSARHALLANVRMRDIRSWGGAGRGGEVGEGDLECWRAVWRRRGGVVWEKSDKSDKSKYRKSCRARAYLPLRDTPPSFPPASLYAHPTKPPSHLGTCADAGVLLVSVVTRSPRKQFLSIASPMRHVARSRDIVTCLRCKAPNCIVVAVAVHVRPTLPRARLIALPPFFPAHPRLSHTTYADDNNIRHAPAIPSLFELTALSCSFFFTPFFLWFLPRNDRKSARPKARDVRTRELES